MKNLADTTFKAGVWTDSTGHYRFENLRNGEYKILVSAMGYKDYLKNIKLESAQIFDIELAPTHTQLQEVAINANTEK